MPDATAFCTTTVASFRNTKKSALPFTGEVVVTTAHCTHQLQQPEYSKTIKLIIDLLRLNKIFLNIFMYNQPRKTQKTQAENAVAQLTFPISGLRSMCGFPRLRECLPK
jgi:hypothetical protein